jgi:hypothetical protein
MMSEPVKHPIRGMARPTMSVDGEQLQIPMITTSDVKGTMRREESLVWPIFRQQYEAVVVRQWSKLDRAIWRNVADDLERLADPATLADAAGSLAAFEAA